MFFFFNDTATTEIYTLSLHDALPISTRFVAGFMGEAVFLPAHVHDALLTCELGVVSTVPGWSRVDVDVEVVLRPHEVALAPDPDGNAVVRGVEYHEIGRAHV